MPKSSLTLKAKADKDVITLVKEDPKKKEEAKQDEKIDPKLAKMLKDHPYMTLQGANKCPIQQAQQNRYLANNSGSDAVKEADIKKQKMNVAKPVKLTAAKVQDDVV